MSSLKSKSVALATVCLTIFFVILININGEEYEIRKIISTKTLKQENEGEWGKNILYLLFVKTQ